MEAMGKRGVAVVVSGTPFSGNGAWVYFRDETVVSAWAAPGSTGDLTGTWPANMGFPIPTTGLTVTSGYAIVGKSDI